MADEFVMPKLGLTMEAGTIVGWLVEDGTEVEAGQPVLVIETDKVESEVEVNKAGFFHPLGEVGQEYACGAHIGWTLAAGEDPPAKPQATPSPVSAATGIGGRLLASPNAKRIAASRGVDLRTVVGTGPGGRITSEDVPTTSVQTAPPPPPPPPPLPSLPSVSAASSADGGRQVVRSGGGTLATAAARNLADLLGVDLADVRPVGADPRVTKEDVAAHVRGLLADAVAPSASQDPTAVIPLVGMRGTIARRMTESLQTMAQLSLTMEVNMNGVVADRNRRKAEAEAAGGGSVPGFTDYVIAAAAEALVDHPHVNSQITADGVALLPRVNVGLAVALDGGLIVPVVQDTPSLSLEQLAIETSRLADAARSGSLKLADLEGGTFSVTALGMFDVDGFTPIINTPNTAILGVGRLRDDVAWSSDDQPIKETRLTLSLTWDHRAFDGAPAAEFTRSIKLGLEAYLSA